MFVCVCAHSFTVVNIYYAKLVMHWMKEFNVMGLFYLPRDLTQWIPLTLFTSEETEAQQGYINRPEDTQLVGFDSTPELIPVTSTIGFGSGTADCHLNLGMSTFCQV